MIITKTPFRISFAGGGTDMADFYREYGGCVLSSTINRYIYIMVHPYFEASKTLLKYSQTELVEDIGQINHSIFRCVLNEKKLSGVEITSTADVPSGTGLGSSSSFTVGLLHTIACFQNKSISKATLAEEACRIEIEELGAPIGKQDQYAASFGGLNFISFKEDDSVSVEPLFVNKKTIESFQDNLVMFYTGLTHNANEILSEQRKNILTQKGKKRNLVRICELAKYMKESLENGELDLVGNILNENWHKKKEMASGISNPRIDDLYNRAINNGAIGGKLLGAGGGGFLLFYCPKEKQENLKRALNLKTFDFRFEKEGSSVIYAENKYLS